MPRYWDPKAGAFVESTFNEPHSAAEWEAKFVKAHDDATSLQMECLKLYAENDALARNLDDVTRERDKFRDLAIKRGEAAGTLGRETARLRAALERFKVWADKYAEEAKSAAAFRATDQYREMCDALAREERPLTDSPDSI